MTVNSPQIFRSRRLKGWLCILACLTFTAFGGLFLALGGPQGRWWGVAFTVWGCLGVAVGIVTLRRKVIVDSQGITKQPGFQFRWEQMASWTVLPARDTSMSDDTFTSWVVRFRIDGWTFNREIDDTEVWSPGFDQFVASLRQHIGDREAKTEQEFPPAKASLVVKSTAASPVSLQPDATADRLRPSLN